LPDFGLSVYGQGKGEVGHRVHEVVVSISELPGKGLKGARREVKIHAIAHGIMLHGAIAYSDRNGAQDIATTLRTYVVKVGKLRTAEVAHVEALERYEEEHIMPVVVSKVGSFEQPLRVASVKGEIEGGSGRTYSQLHHLLVV